VAKNDSYLELAHALADHALNFETKDAFLSSEFQGTTVAEKLTEQTGVIGEKIEIGGFSRFTAPFVGSYIHAGNKIATLVGLSGIVENAAEIAKNVAMQAAAMNPIALNEEGVDASIVEKEIEIAKDQLRQEGKPEAMLENIAKGKIKRFFKDNTLVNQAYIKDGKISVADYVKSADPDLLVTGFERVALG
jgi:elongation factor Ts